MRSMTLGRMLTRITGISVKFCRNPGMLLFSRMDFGFSRGPDLELTRTSTCVGNSLFFPEPLNIQVLKVF